jgi:hypothetical protein
MWTGNLSLKRGAMVGSLEHGDGRSNSTSKECLGQLSHYNLLKKSQFISDACDDYQKGKLLDDCI